MRLQSLRGFKRCMKSGDSESGAGDVGWPDGGNAGIGHKTVNAAGGPGVASAISALYWNGGCSDISRCRHNSRCYHRSQQQQMEPVPGLAVIVGHSSTTCVEGARESDSASGCQAN